MRAKQAKQDQQAKPDQPARQDQLSRREFIAASSQAFTSAFALASTGFGALGFSSLLSGCSTTPAGRTLNILNWADYLHPEAIPEFEKRYGVKVIYDTFASNEALLAKLQAGGSRYDIIVPSSYMVKQLRKLELLLPVDHSRIKGLSGLLPRFWQAAYDPGLKYCVPYTWGTTGIGFSADAMRRRGLMREDLPELSWEVFWDNRFASRLTLLDDAREVLGMALKLAGHSYNSRDAAEIARAKDALVKQKPLTMCYTSDQVIVELSSGDAELAQVFSGDAYQARRENKDVRYVIPSCGTSIWTDNFCIPKTAPHEDLAYLWINYMMEKQVAAACANYTNYAIANRDAWELVDSHLRDDPNLYPAGALLERCEELADVGSALFIYDRMWTELKCA